MIVLTMFRVLNIHEGEWGKLHNEKLHDWYSSPNIIQVIQSRRERLAGHVACEAQNPYCFLE
jgi:hypothetical protein